jgi:hypothetical protein
VAAKAHAYAKLKNQRACHDTVQRITHEVHVTSNVVLSLAFADNVFKNLFSHRNLEKVKRSPSNYVFRAQHTKGTLQRPVLRSINPNRSILEPRI